MGSAVINLARSDRIDSSSHTMFGAATDPAESLYRSSSRQASQQPSYLEPGSSSSASASATPTSSTAPPSSATASARPPHLQRDVPPYIRRQSSQSSTLSSSMRTSSTSAASAPQYSQASSMSSSSQAPTPSHSAHPATYPYQNPGNLTRFSTESFTSVPQAASQSSPASPRLQPTIRSLRSLGGSEASSPSRIKVRDLSHIHSFASEEVLAQPQRSQAAGQWPQDRQYEISSMPVTDIIQMVAGLLTKITSTNDLHHEQVHQQIPSPDGTSNLSPQATSVLAFHGKNVPSITILSYLTRIHRYCPTTYEVFLSLLVYFDRMTEIVNKGHLERLRHGYESSTADQPGAATPSGTASAERPHESPMVTPPSSSGMAAQDPKTQTVSPSLDPQDESESLSQFFVVDSFNIHRLVIAGVTCASKFFSDVFYTNSRYAKVGGLPLVELNHLELQFLVLNDFRLSIPVEELEAYGTMLVEFYAREIVSQQQQSQTAASRVVDPLAQSQPEGMYMRSSDKRRMDYPEVRQTPTPP